SPGHGNGRGAPSLRRTPASRPRGRSRPLHLNGSGSSGPGSASPSPRGTDRPAPPPSRPAASHGAGPRAARSAFAPPPRPLRRVLEDDAQGLELGAGLVGAPELPLEPRLLALVEERLLLWGEPILRGRQQHAEHAVHRLQLPTQQRGAFPGDGAFD